MQNFNILRNKYKEFIYKKYEIYDKEDSIIIKYYFEIPNLSQFEPSIKIYKKDIKFNVADNEFIKNIIFNLGMVEAISYWKCVCPEKLVVECGFLNNEQIEFFQKLFYLGLGEFRYINNIKVKQDKFIKIVAVGEEKILENDELENKVYRGALIPIGGGKDSTVTLELLNKDKENNLCIMIGGKEPSINCAKIAGYDDKHIINVTREIDGNLLKLNEKGFLNGHTPFSAMLAFLSYLIAYLTDRKYIPLSNESSANESNIEGEKINHQYSKTFEFEQDFRKYSKEYLKGNIEYFSILRPLNELQIAMLFSQNEKYHKIFKSCNVGSKENPWIWCCNCPKCLFVYIILSPFLYKEKLINIFGEDLFEKHSLLETFIELCGYGETKPFECVGTYEEVNFAISKTIENLESNNIELSYLLKVYREKYGVSNTSINILDRYNNENNLPKEFNKILKKLVKGDFI